MSWMEKIRKVGIWWRFVVVVLDVAIARVSSEERQMRVRLYCEDEGAIMTLWI